MTGPLLMDLKSWWWRRHHRPEDVGLERLSHFPANTTTWDRLLFVQHFLPVKEAAERPWPRRSQ